MQRSRLVGIGILVTVTALAGGVTAQLTSPTQNTKQLEARFVSPGQLPGSWSISSGPSSLNVLTIPPKYRCALPPTALYGSLLVNEQYQSATPRIHVNETIGFASTSAAAKASDLLRKAAAGQEACLRRSEGSSRRVSPNPYFAETRPYATAFGFTSYCPAKDLAVPKLTSAVTVSRSGISLCPQGSWVFYTVVSDGFVANIIEHGRLTTGQAADVADRLAAKL